MTKSLAKLALILLLGFSISAAGVVPTKDIICSTEDPTDCYPSLFKPSAEWAPIREGQQIPQGLDIRLDWQTGEKFGKLGEDTKDVKDVIIHQDILESDKNKVVSYSDEDSVEDSDIKRLKMSAQSSNIPVDLEDALEVVIKSLDGVKDETKLIDALDSLADHSHNLKDGLIISEPQSFNALSDIALAGGFSTEVQELALRVLAQSLRHNLKALENVNAEMSLNRLLTNLQKQGNSVLQKRLLGVISSLIQTEQNSEAFLRLGGESLLLNSFPSLKEDSKLRVIEILDDLKSLKRLEKRSTQHVDTILFDVIQTSLSSDSIGDDYSMETLFDKLVELKKNDKTLKVKDDFLEWLTNHIHTRKLNKRTDEEDNLSSKLLEARHVVFGNPNALRKALADEL